MNNDLISREALKKAITEATYNFEQIPIRVDKVQEIIDNAPTVEVGYLTNCANCERVEKIRAKRPQGEWIPVTMRPIEEEEKIDFPDATFMFDCLMPEDGQQILISTKYGVEFDTCFADDGYYLDSDRDWEDVYAWQPLPKPYKEDGADMMEVSGDE